VSKKTPRPRRKKRPRLPTDRRSPWNYLAPAALLAAVTAITLILSSAGVLGHTSDGSPPVDATARGGPVETLSVPQTAPPPEPPPPQPQPVPPEPPPPPATTAGTTTATTSSTETTTSETTTETTAETTTETTGSPGQHVKWTVKPGDTLASIATQFGTSVRALQRLNPSIDPDTLQIGQEIIVR
jgi:LysM domain